MKVYGCANTRSVRVVWTLEEIGARYDYERVDIPGGAGRRPGYLRINPGGKVPALEVGDLVLTESAAICTWLGARHPASGLVPPSGTASHAAFLRWTLFAVTELEQPLWTIAKHKFALPEARRVPAIVDTARWEYEVAVKILDSGLGDREYLAADGFTVADILVAHTLSWGRKAAPDTETPRLTRYVDRMLARPALARAREREAA